MVISVSILRKWDDHAIKKNFNRILPNLPCELNFVYLDRISHFEKLRRVTLVPYILHHKNKAIDVESNDFDKDIFELNREREKYIRQGSKMQLHDSACCCILVYISTLFFC